MKMKKMVLREGRVLGIKNMSPIVIVKVTAQGFSVISKYFPSEEHSEAPHDSDRSHLRQCSKNREQEYHVRTENYNSLTPATNEHMTIKRNTEHEHIHRRGNMRTRRCTQSREQEHQNRDQEHQNMSTEEEHKSRKL